MSASSWFKPSVKDVFERGDEQLRGLLGPDSFAPCTTGTGKNIMHYAAKYRPEWIPWIVSQIGRDRAVYLAHSCDAKGRLPIQLGWSHPDALLLELTRAPHSLVGAAAAVGDAKMAKLIELTTEVRHKITYTQSHNSSNSANESVRALTRDKVDVVRRGVKRDLFLNPIVLFQLWMGWLTPERVASFVAARAYAHSAGNCAEYAYALYDRFNREGVASEIINISHFKDGHVVVLVGRDPKGVISNPKT